MYMLVHYYRQSAYNFISNFLDACVRCKPVAIINLEACCTYVLFDFQFLKGTAEVVFTRRSDAVAALKRYNNVLLDGKAMKIEVIGSDLGLPMTPRINVVGASNGRPTRTVVMTPETVQRGGGSSNRPLSNPTNRFNRGAIQTGRGRGRGRTLFQTPFQAQFQGRGRGRGQFRGRGQGRKQAEKSADELDKDLESYHAEAMKTE
uniref:Uncharacterized protein n=1 Tax=Avena sativa TaxID=4498 RepID=A0ACD6AKF0_AVESA